MKLPKRPEEVLTPENFILLDMLEKQFLDVKKWAGNQQDAFRDQLPRMEKAQKQLRNIALQRFKMSQPPMDGLLPKGMDLELMTSPLLKAFISFLDELETIDEKIYALFIDIIDEHKQDKARENLLQFEKLIAPALEQFPRLKQRCDTQENLLIAVEQQLKKQVN
ncbi:MAG: hypothetical protein V4615_01120 [Bacteroidota bacterium]